MGRPLRFALAFALACCAPPCAAPAADSFYSPTIAGIDKACDGYRARAKRADVVRLARTVAADGTAGAWSPSDEAASARMQSSPSFGAGDFATAILDGGAVVSAYLAHDDASAGRATVYAWCFIGGKLSRASVDVASTGDRAVGYRRTRYYGDDLDEPLAETMTERGLTGKAFRPPSKEVDALLVVQPDPRPENLPFYDALRAVRPGLK